MYKYGIMVSERPSLYLYNIVYSEFFYEQRQKQTYTPGSKMDLL